MNGDPTVDVVTQVLPRAGRRLRDPRARAAALGPTTTGFLLALLTGLFLCARRGDPAQRQRVRTARRRRSTRATAPRTSRSSRTHWGLVDYGYKDLPSFYPPLFFWVLGRLSALLGIAAVADAQGRPARLGLPRADRRLAAVATDHRPTPGRGAW